jgi:hypothetical protein
MSSLAFKGWTFKSPALQALVNAYNYDHYRIDARDPDGLETRYGHLAALAEGRDSSEYGPPEHFTDRARELGSKGHELDGSDATIRAGNRGYRDNGEMNRQWAAGGTTGTVRTNGTSGMDGGEMGTRKSRALSM